MSRGERALAAARAMIGVRFRLHGRSARDGLDCVGLAAAALRAAGAGGTVPSGYALRSGDAAAAIRTIEGAGLVRATAPRTGDLLLLRVGAGQLHLAIASEDGLIHADAMLRRVVERPDVPWPLMGRWCVAEGE